MFLAARDSAHRAPNDTDDFQAYATVATTAAGRREPDPHVRFVITDIVRTMGDHHSPTFVHASSVILDVKSWKHCRRRENAIEPAVIFLRT
jgi:hypothetical protein